MMRKRTIKRETTHNGMLKTQVTFQRMGVAEDFYESERVVEEAFTTWAQVYKANHQDLEDLKGRFAKNALALESIKSRAVMSYATIKIRDPLSDFQPRNSDHVVITDSRYTDRVWEVVEVQPDFFNRGYLIVHLAGVV